MKKENLLCIISFVITRNLKSKIAKTKKAQLFQIKHNNFHIPLVLENPIVILAEEE